MEKSPRTTHLCLVRHGESLWNAENRVQGQLDPALSPLGEFQAQAVAARLSGESWDVLYASDLSRACVTAEAIARRTGLIVQRLADLRERYMGCLEGLLSDEARTRYPDWDAPDVGRESREAFLARAIKVFSQILAENGGRRILVVTHGGLIKQYLLHLSAGAKGWQIDNTGITRVEWSDDGGSSARCRLICVNDVDHLSGLKVKPGRVL
jgi:probable phosphoglycerate mutase